MCLCVCVFVVCVCAGIWDYIHASACSTQPPKAQDTAQQDAGFSGHHYRMDLRM